MAIEIIVQNSINLIPNQQIIIGILAALLIVILSYRVKFLTFSGSIATFFLAGLLFSLGGIKWSVPILTFFILSSVLSKLRKMKNEQVELFFEKSGVRDYLQVLANGGIGGVLVILYSIFSYEIFYFIYLASLAAVCADTWATELGTWKRTTTYNILNMKPIEQGISGGISVIGTFGALMGSVAIAISGVFWIRISLVEYFLLIVISGIVGSFIDSILGATIQLQKQCNVCAKVTERNLHCGQETKFYSGLNWINNDMVNFFSGLSGSVFVVILIKLING